jgi:excinuclease ABC subunit A
MERTGGIVPVAERLADEAIRIRGARVHNLHNLDLDIPRNRLVVLTGPSGSGKSSLAFDTLYAEGQRQYIESLSVYARQFFHQIERPDVDLIEGLQPTICIDQRVGIRNPRSTVATVTEVYDYLRLLMARLGEPSCYRCGAPIRQQTREQILEDLLALPEGTRLMLLAPLVRGRKGEHQDVLAAVRKAGLLRARVDGEVIDVNAPPKLVRQKTHQIEAVIDRVVIRPTAAVRDRLAESLTLALKHGEGLAMAAALRSSPGEPPAWRDRLFSTLYACPHCKISYEELEPRTFSFNSPYGACPACDGLGVRVQFDPDLVVPQAQLSLDEGAIAAWKVLPSRALQRQRAAVSGFLASADVSWDRPLAAWKAKVREQWFSGNGKDFPGLLALLEQEYATNGSTAVRQRLEAFRGETACPECGGARLRPEARSVRVAGRAIHQIAALSVGEAREFFAGLEFPASRLPVARPLLACLESRLEFLERVGLGYLTLDRPADTLSGGELQRVRLATGLGSGLVGVCYVLDEPSVGLHPRDNQRLIKALRELQVRGNTVVVVEHDEAMMREGDWLVDLGPGAGQHGGRIMAQGTLDQIVRDPDSLTGRYLAGCLRIPVPPQRRAPVRSRMLTLQGVTTNNLKNVTAQFPLSVLVCVTGVSGSGKSSLVDETLARALVRRLGGVGPKPGPHAGLRGASNLDKVVRIDQSPIGRTPRSSPATYTGVFDEIRKIFASTRSAKQRGYHSGRFSFNVPGGRCEECQGQGHRKIEMNFLPDLYLVCPACEGRRFNRQTLDVRYRGLSIAEVLDLRVDEAAALFENFSAIARWLGTLQQVGLGYLSLGQSSITLSGGEAQRIKLAAELGRANTGKTAYILDEPTTGLHVDDIRKLLEVLGRLVDLGNTVILTEHNLDVIKSADWVIDLGPEGGQRGGHIVATGTPEQIAALADNATGRYLRAVLPGDEG